MRNRHAAVQPIVLRHQIVAVVAGGEALITSTLNPPDAVTVKAMCLFAIALQAGEIDGPYTDVRALAYARRAAGFRQAAMAPRPARR